MILPEKEIVLTLPQLLFTQSQHKEVYLEWGRGGGKSTVIGWRVKEVVKHMPRCKYGIVGSSYQQLLTRTLPSTVEGLEMLGFKKDQHYFVGRRPPVSWKWPEAYQPPLSYDNSIIFYNGATFPLISLDNPDSGRGLNLDGGIGDESGTLDKEKLDHSFLLSIRGNVHRFSHYLHQSTLFAGTTPLGRKGRWFIDVDEQGRLHPNEILFMIASSLYNAHNLGKAFFNKNRRLLTELIYNAEILCIRPGRVQTGFYPSFSDDHHCYEASNDNFVLGAEYNLDILRGRIPDVDVNPDDPLDIACDYNAAICPMVVGQELSEHRYNVVRGIHVKQPQTISDLATLFCDTFSDQRRKEVNYYYDHTAVARNASSAVTFADEVMEVLRSRGWEVNAIYVGQAPRHDTKYLFMDKLFKESEPLLPQVRFNEHNCKYLVVSVQNAGARTGRSGIEKDKRPEHQKGAIDEETTHYSDAMDTLLYFRLKERLEPAGWYGG